MVNFDIALSRLRQFLISAGYALVSRASSPEVFGNEVELFEKDRVWIQLLKDRSRWFVDLGSDPDHLFSVAVWMGVLGKLEIDGPAPTFDSQAGFVESDLARFEESLRDNPGAISLALTRWRERRSVERMKGDGAAKG
jgi:hypothetical protein